MAKWVALLRGINVGGKNSLPMTELVGDMEACGLRNVRTYIQSGNAVFESPGKVPASLGPKIASRILERRGFEPHILLLSAAAFQKAIRANPYPEATAEPKTLHFGFLAASAKSPDTAALAAVQSPSERFELIGKVFYLHAPDGIGRSKLAVKIEKALGVPVTGRNWRTVDSLREMLAAS
jgi:uncharacterized protein (DUF1697 family)